MWFSNHMLAVSVVMRFQYKYLVYVSVVWVFKSRRNPGLHRQQFHFNLFLSTLYIFNYTQTSREVQYFYCLQVAWLAIFQNHTLVTFSLWVFLKYVNMQDYVRHMSLKHETLNNTVKASHISQCLSSYHSHSASSESNLFYFPYWIETLSLVLLLTLYMQL